VAPTSAIEAPKFSVEMLRTEDEVQLSGLIPEAPGEGGLSEEALAEAAAALSKESELPDMLETAGYPAPETWNAALDYGLKALQRLELSKVSVSAERVAITAIAASEDEKRRLEHDLRAIAPQGVQLVLDISAPRPVITPFTMRLVFDAGAARDDGAGGLASTVATMLSQGTVTRDTSAIAAAFEQVGAQFAATSHRDMAVVELRVLSAPEFRAPALDVLADVLARPAFPPHSFARIQQASEVGQQQQEQSPAALANRLYYQELYGHHPYATPPRGTRESLARLTREQLQAFHQRYYVARNMTIALVGQLSRAEAETLAESPTAHREAETAKAHRG